VAQDPLHCAPGDANAEVAELANDPQVAPPRILARQPHDDLPDLIADGRTTQLGIGPPATHQIAMPTQDRRRRNHERRPSNSGKQPRQQRRRMSARPSRLTLGRHISEPLLEFSRRPFVNGLRRSVGTINSGVRPTRFARLLVCTEVVEALDSAAETIASDAREAGLNPNNDGLPRCLRALDHLFHETTMQPRRLRLPSQFGPRSQALWHGLEPVRRLVMPAEI